MNLAAANTRAAQSAAKSPADLYDEGRASFGEQRYRAALDAFETLRKNAPDWRPRESESWRLSAALRWAQESLEHGDLDTLVLEAKLFLKSEEMDRPGARVAAEIVRIQGPDADGGQIFDEAATYWESQKVERGEHGGLRGIVSCRARGAHSLGESGAPLLAHVAQPVPRARATRSPLLAGGDSAERSSSQAHPIRGGANARPFRRTRYATGDRARGPETIS